MEFVRGAARVGLMAVATLVALVGCTERGSLLARSAHFAVHLHGEATPADGMLARLEADYRDQRAFLGFPAAHIDYHLYASPEELAGPCSSGDGTQVVGCAQGTTVHTTNPLHHHELIHAYLAAVSVPPPVLSEGIAEGVACDGTAVPANVEVTWDQVITEPTLNRAAVHTAGMELFVFLTRTFGIERFIAFYAATGDTRDAETFADQFRSFWGVSIDDAWRDMQVPRTPGGRIHAICPCTQTAGVLDGSGLDFAALDTAVVPLGDLPAEDAGSLLVTAAGPATLANCAQDYLSVNLSDESSVARQDLTAVRLLPERHFVSAGLETAVSMQAGAFVAPACEDATPVAVPQDYAGALGLVVSRAADEPPATAWYARFTFEDGPHVLSGLRTTGPQSVLICPSCADARAATENCLVGGRGETVVVPGSEVVVRATFNVSGEAVGATSADVVPRDLP